MLCAPKSFKRFAIVDFPLAVPPVNPITKGLVLNCEQQFQKELVKINSKDSDQSLTLGGLMWDPRRRFLNDDELILLSSSTPA